MEPISVKIKRYAKFVVAVAGAVAIAANEVVIGRDVERPEDAVTIIIAILTALGVAAKRNAP